MVRSPFEDTGALVPAFISMNPPVPKVTFTSPSERHCWPNRAACWSPMDPAIGTDTPTSAGSVVPNTHPVGRISGRASIGTPRIPARAGSHARVRMSMSMVRDALEWSVACTRPPVRFQMIHESTVPRASLPETALSRTTGTWSSIQRNLVPEK